MTALAMTWEGTDTLTEVDVSTLTMPVGTMTTTIRQTNPTLPVGVVDALSDDEIEKAIREIRESIRRSNQALPKE